MNLNELARQLTRTARPSLQIGEAASTGAEISYQMSYLRPGLEYSRYFDGIYNIVGHEGRTKAILSSAFWQIITSSASFYRYLRSLGIPLYSPFHSGRSILVMHGEGNQERYDLVILSPFVRWEQRRAVSIDDFFSNSDRSPREFSRELNRWLDRRNRELDQIKKENPLNIGTLETQELLLTSIRDRNDNFLENLVSTQTFSIIFAPMPDTTLSNSIGVPACGVAFKKDSYPISTVGVITTKQNGLFGVTAALHGVVPNPEDIYEMFNKKGAACVIGKKVYVNGQEGTIREADLITDSCFIELNPSGITNTYKTSGPMKDVAPYRRERVKFEGIGSNEQKSTVITEVDIAIPFISRGEQARVYTQAVTNPGDSGAALVNDKGQVLGFSYRRTGLGEPIEFAEWIWAHSVYNALKLKT